MKWAVNSLGCSALYQMLFCLYTAAGRTFLQSWASACLSFINLEMTRVFLISLLLDRHFCTHVTMYDTRDLITQNIDSRVKLVNSQLFSTFATSKFIFFYKNCNFSLKAQTAVLKIKISIRTITFCHLSLEAVKNCKIW